MIALAAGAMDRVRRAAGGLPVTSPAVEFIGNFTAADAPAAVAHQARRCLLDLIGVAAAASRLEVSRITGAVAQAQFGGSAARFLFDGRGASAAGAALRNAMAIDGFDAHDGHPLTKGHAGCGTLSAVLAFAGTGDGLSGRDMLSHLVVGYEIAIRAGNALHRTACDYHPTGAWVAVAAAGLGARMTGLDAARTREALGIAEYYGPRSQMMRCIDHPTMVKDGSGWGTMAGVTAAFLAREGFTGAPAVTVEGDDSADLWADLGQCWRITEQYFKPYPVCRWAQPAMEAAAALKRQHGFAAQDIAVIRVRSFHEAVKLATRQPRGTDDAQYSLPFPVATLLVHGKVGAAEIDGNGLRDPAVLRLSNLIELIEEPRYSKLFPAERWAEMEIETVDGRVLSSGPAVARGSAENPLSDAEISAKFHALMAGSGFGERAAQVEDMVMTLESQASVRPLLDLIFAPAIPVQLRGAAR
jgi:2-methylcitrate dehydratase PrpD